MVNLERFITDFATSTIRIVFGYLYNRLSPKFKKLAEDFLNKPEETSREMLWEYVDALGEYIKGSLGTELIKAMEKYLKDGDFNAFSPIKNYESNEVNLVIEISRRISDSVEVSIGKSVEYIFSSLGEIDPNEISAIAILVAKLVKLLSVLHKKTLINLYYSGPASLSFILGQTIGTNYKVRFNHFQDGDYIPLPIVDKELISKI
ncbi:MAG: SAVED domain-containing protein [Candidatus Njordarchaeia archaeon]